MSSIQEELSRRVYHSRGIDSAYQNWQAVPIDEVAALLKHQAAFVGRDVLDLGVGTGRTSRFLAPLARRYEAVDFSPVMVESVRQNVPGVSVRLGDIRDLSDFEESSFDFVLGSNNVISAVGHRDRLRVMDEVHRVLRPGGTFVFSSHNRAFRDAGEGPQLHLHRNPVTAINDLLTYVKRQLNHARVKQHRADTEEYALLDDVGHDFRLLHYYIDRPHAERQLREAGFEVSDVFSPRGRRLGEDDQAENAPFLLYVAHKWGRHPATSKGRASEERDAPGNPVPRSLHQSPLIRRSPERPRGSPAPRPIER